MAYADELAAAHAEYDAAVRAAQARLQARLQQIEATHRAPEPPQLDEPPPPARPMVGGMHVVHHAGHHHA